MAKERNRGTKAPPVQPKPEPIDNTELVTQFRAEGGGILHIRPKQAFMSMKPTRGVTLAFKIKGKRVEVASALQHRSDCFSKKVGTKTAIEHFQKGKTLVLPLNSNAPIASLKRAMANLV